jgi:beta-mannosidase
LDLAADGLIQHPFGGQAEAGCQWVDLEDWEYRTVFNWSPSGLPKQVLRFEGLDACCTVLLNGGEIGKHDNMFVPLEIDVAGRLEKGSNELIVRFESAIRVGDLRRTAYFEQEKLSVATENFNERAFVRKAQYMFGWDWGPRLVSCGIWKPVELIEYDSRILSFSIFQEKLESGSFRVWTETDSEGNGALHTKFGDHEQVGDLDITLENPMLWWPNGMGEQHLYEASASIEGHQISKHVGLRTIDLVREEDKHGESFRFEVNGKRMWAKGANWIPNDSFPSRVSDQHYAEQIQQCAELNFNMLRVWGGGLYESDAFYDACDKRGILVWQDFPFACSYYPDDATAQAAITPEAEYQVRRLRDRTSLAMWCGNNENLQMWEQKWGSPGKMPPRYYGEHIYRKALPEIVSRLSPGTPFIESSPVSGLPSSNNLANDGGIGDQHYWDVWHGRGDWKYYAESTGRFASEFGFASSCSPRQWASVMELSPGLKRDDPTVRWHDKTLKPFEVFSGLVALHYPDSESLEDWIYYSQLNQRDALRFAIERFRTSGICDGALIWQFNDCWPVQSWAVQEYSRLLKPSGFELQRLYASECIAAIPMGNEVEVFFISQSQSPKEVMIEAVSTTNGALIERRTIPASAEGTLIDTRSYEPENTAIRLSVEDRAVPSRWLLLTEPKNMVFGTPEVRTRLASGGLEIHVQGLLFDGLITNVATSEGGLKGFPALTLWNETKVIGIDTTKVELRWLGSRICTTTP